MLKGTLNSSLWLIRTKKLYSDGDELSVVYCTVYVWKEAPCTWSKRAKRHLILVKFRSWLIEANERIQSQMTSYLLLTCGHISDGIHEDNIYPPHPCHLYPFHNIPIPTQYPSNSLPYIPSTHLHLYIFL